tara:strand:+ start:63982 stop:65172 length:1191 start_codon:yes stop_codon:yes gene_type:complete
MIHVAFVVLRMDTGGAERCIARLANGLDRDQFRVSIICMVRSGEAALWIKRDDVDVIELNCPEGNNLTSVRRLAECVRRIKPDIVQSHNWGTLLETHFAVRSISGISHIHAERGTVLGTNHCGPKQRWLRRIAMRYACRRARGIVTNADSIAAKVASIVKTAKSTIHVIPNGVDPAIDECDLGKEAARCRAMLGIDSDDFLFTSVGRMVAVKNFSLAIEAFAGLQQSNQKRARLLLVGEGPRRKQWQQLANDRGVGDRVIFAGAQKDVWPYLAASDVFINTSHSEGMSQSLLEAMSVGVPIIATDVGDAKKIVASPMPCGTIVPPGDCDQLKQAMADAMTNGQWMSEMSEAARAKHRDKYGLQSMIRQHEDYYRHNVIGGTKTRMHRTAAVMGATS